MWGVLVFENNRTPWAAAVEFGRGEFERR